MIPSKTQRDEWRQLAADTMMTSALGEYTPSEFVVLLDAVDELEAKKTSKQIAVLVTEFEAAVWDKAWRGGKDPEMWADIDRNYLKAKAKLMEALQ